MSEGLTYSPCYKGPLQVAKKQIKNIPLSARVAVLRYTSKSYDSVRHSFASPETPYIIAVAPEMGH